jgi:NADPH:quinone reductase-like Zn-dependent oxidoreductase
VKAVAFDRFGGPEVVQVKELPVPEPEAGEVVIRVAVSTVNPTDLLMRSGQQAGLMKHLQPPYIAGMEFAGIVHAAGGSQRVRPGQKVYGMVNPRRQQGGAHVEYLCVPEASVVPLPDSADLADAATIPMNGLTAKMAMDSLDLKPGATLLVTGGAGAVGGYVIALAKQAGLRVVADAKESDRDLLQSLGVCEVVPRGAPMAPAVRTHHPDGVDAVVDAALLGDGVAALVREGGTFVSVRRSQKLADERLRLVTLGVLEQAKNTAALQWLAQRFLDGTLKPRIALRMPPERAAEANRLLEQGGLRGRIVLEF